MKDLTNREIRAQKFEHMISPRINPSHWLAVQITKKQGFHPKLTTKLTTFKSIQIFSSINSELFEENICMDLNVVVC